MLSQTASLNDRMIETIADMAIKLCDDQVNVAAILASNGDASLVNFGSLRAALDTLDVYLNQATSVLAGANAITTKSVKIEPGKRFPNPKSTYIGFTFGRINEFVESVFSLELHLKLMEEPNEKTEYINVSGNVLYKICSVTARPGYETKPDAEFINQLRKTIETNGAAELTIGGKYVLDTGLLMLDDLDVIKDETGFTKQARWVSDSYRLLVSPDAKELTGTLRGWNKEWDIAFRADAF